MSWWLVFPDGVRRRLDRRGLALGRGPSCDVVLDDPKASSLHAVLMLTARGPELRALGRNPTLVDGQAVSGAALQDGALIEVPGCALRLRRAEPDEPGWTMEYAGRTYALRGGPLRIGGGPGCDLLLPGWPQEAVVLGEVQGSLVAEFLAPVELSGRRQEVGAVETLEDGDRIAWQGEALALAQVVGPVPPTVQKASMPVEVHFTFLPTGGRLVLGYAGGQRAEVELPELRARLVATLLQPDDVAPGEYVDDERVLRRIWPGMSDRGRTDLNQLVHRARKDLLRAGVNPSPLLVRAPGGGGTAFRVAAGATITVD